MRKCADAQTLTAEISLDCGNFLLAAVNMLFKVETIWIFELYDSNSSSKFTLKPFNGHF